MKGSEIFSRAIKDLGLGPLFGNPGSTELGMLRNIDDYILTLHDSISVGMADGRSQVLRKPSVVNLHTLPGLANSMAFLHTAQANRSPVIVTAGQQVTRHAVYDPFLQGDHLSLASGAVKFRYVLKQTSDIAVVMKRAAEIAMEPPAGPVFLSFPMDILDYDARYEEVRLEERKFELVDEGAVEEVCSAINESVNPAIVFGYEIDVFDAFSEAEKFAAALGAPVYGEALSSRAMFNSGSRSYAGDLLPASTLMNLTLQEHDLVVFIGGSFTLYPYISSPVFPGKRTIFIGLDLSHRIGESYLMNPKMFLRQAAGKIRKKGSYSRKDDLTAASAIAKEKKNMGLKYVLSRASRTFKGYTVVDESTSSSPALRAAFGYGKDRYFTARSGQLGWGMAGALGITMQRPETLYVVGDGSVMYLIQGLWTAKRYGIPLKMLVLDNGGYNILRSYSKSYYPELENAGFLKLGLDLESIISGFGVETRVADRDLTDMEWLKEGGSAKALIVGVNREVPKLFL